MDENSMIGKEIGNYRIVAEINSGAFGSVYKAEHKHLKERVVAIKLLHTYMSSPQEREQFAQEAQILSLLEHPHILPLYDFGFNERQPYLIAKYAAGGSLRDRLKQQKVLPIEQVVNIVAQVGQALQYAHQHNVIHRDLKPENILFDAQGNALLADFGIATMLSTASVKHLTTIGGTPPYMAPEQFQGHISKEGDQYALGCITYELVTGYLPFTAPDFLSMGFKHLTEQPVQPTRHNPQIPAPIETAILKAMAKQRVERHTDIQAFLAGLREPFTRATIIHVAPPPSPIQPTVPVVPAPRPVTPKSVEPSRRSGASASPAPRPVTPKPVEPSRRSGVPASPLPPGRVGTPSPLPAKPSFSQRLRRFVFGSLQEEGYDLLQDDSSYYVADDDKRLLYTALDIGNEYAKAMIVEVRDDIGVVLGVGRSQQSYSHMSDGVVTDIAGAIANCNKALLRARETAGGIIAPNTVIGIAGELVKGSSVTIIKQRQHPSKPITPEELEHAIFSAQQKLLKSAKERMVQEIGYPNIDMRLVNSAVTLVSIDGQVLTNPVGFRGRHFTLTIFSTFAPLMQLGALQTVAQGLDLTLVSVVSEPYALARCLSHNASADSGAIFIDIGGCTTDIALVRQGRIEGTRMFALGGRTFTRRLAAHKGLSLREAELLKLNYAEGLVQGSEKDEIQQIFASETQTWMDSVEFLTEELALGELLPPAIYMVGGGSGLPDLSKKLESFPWTERLSFSHMPIIQVIQPNMVSSIADPNRLLKNAQDIPLMALAYEAIELQDKDSILERALDQVINSMHI